MSRKQSKEGNGEESDETLQASTSIEPFFEIGPEIGSVDSSSSTAPDASATSSTSAESSNRNVSIDEKALPILENLSVPELWAQYVKCLMMAVPSNAGRVDIERSAGIHAEKYLEQILKLSPGCFFNYSMKYCYSFRYGL